MELQTVFDNNKRWVAEHLDEQESYFSELAKGQKPGILYIGCADSRVTAELAMGLGPGEVFVHRNVANVVPNGDQNSGAVIEYAVAHLKVEHVVVCGHYECGGVKAAMQPADLGVLNAWLGHIRDAYRANKDELNAISDEEQRYRRFVELNVQEQCLNLLKLSVVQQARKDRGLKIHGWVFDIATGTFIDLGLDVDKALEDALPIYDLGIS